MPDAKELTQQVNELISKLMDLSQVAEEVAHATSTARGQKCVVPDCLGRKLGDVGVMCHACWDASYDEQGELEAARVVLHALDRWNKSRTDPQHLGSEDAEDRMFHLLAEFHKKWGRPHPVSEDR